MTAFKWATDEMITKAQQRIANHQLELAKIELQRGELRVALRAAQLAAKRLASFQIKIGPNYQCPRCWIERETRIVLTATSSGTEQVDVFRCQSCNSDFIFSP